MPLMDEDGEEYDQEDEDDIASVPPSLFLLSC